jgi:hypothetical protein
LQKIYKTCTRNIKLKYSLTSKYALCYNYITTRQVHLENITIEGACHMANLGETSVPPLVSLKSEALNCIENLLIRDEICIDKYEILNRVLELLGYDNAFDLGEGIKIQLVDSKD